MLLSHMKHLRCRIFWFLQAYVAVGFSQLRLLFVVDMWQTCIIFYALLISVMIHLSGFIVHVKIAFDFELGSLMKSIFVELSIPCLAELSCLDLKTSLLLRHALSCFSRIVCSRCALSLNNNCACTQDLFGSSSP